MRRFREAIRLKRQKLWAATTLGFGTTVRSWIAPHKLQRKLCMVACRLPDMRRVSVVTTRQREFGEWVEEWSWRKRKWRLRFWRTRSWRKTATSSRSGLGHRNLRIETQVAEGITRLSQVDFFTLMSRLHPGTPPRGSVRCEQ